MSSSAAMVRNSVTVVKERLEIPDLTESLKN